MTQDNFLGGKEMKTKTISSIRGIATRVFRIDSDETKDQDGSAMVIALLVMILLMSFVALAISRTNSETVASANDEGETRAYDAAQASLEVMTRNFNKVFETKLNIDPADITRIQGQTPPGFPGFAFTPQLVTESPTIRNKIVTLNGAQFQGLYALRDEWQLDTTAIADQDGVTVKLRRKFFNDRIPIFQFGIFYDDDLEFHPGPRFDFGGRVHSNGSLFLMASTGLYFSSKVTAASHIFTDTAKNGNPWTNWNENVFVKNASGTFVQLRHDMGSVLTSPVNGAPVPTTDPLNPLPTAYTSANWTTNQNQFQGNLLADVTPLKLPLKLNSDQTNQNLDLVEIVKRGKSVGDLYNDGTGTVAAPNIIAVPTTAADDKITQGERYYNKTGIRVNLADSKAKLPGCATSTGAAVTTQCGIRLDGDAGGQTIGGASHVGYVPLAMTGSPAYQATAVNGDRFNMNITGRESWIKIETVVYNSTTQVYDTNDITQDILALGVTDAAPNSASNFVIQDANYNANGYDSRSIVKLQRFAIPGNAAIPNTTGATSTTGYISNAAWGGTTYNFVMPATVSSTTASNRCGTVARTTVNGGTYSTNGFTGDNVAAMKTALITGLVNTYGCVVPFPINMFDTREGLYNDTNAVFNPTDAANYGANVSWAGVMSMVDIDVGNLRTFLNGTYDTKMPAGTPYATATGHVLRSTDIPSNSGWVFYVSDRRGDFDFDGEYDMEDIFGNNDGIMQPGEDVNKNGTLQADYANEAVRYTGAGSNISPDIAAVFEHKYYRRGVRLVNGQTLPGMYDSATPANTKGLTVASENGVYVLGDYNATGIASVGTPTPSTDFLPQGSADIPASIASDAITILSNNWRDSNSFTSPFNIGNRITTETTTRFGLISGDAISSLNATPNQGGGDTRLNGGVHNFLRFLENWGNRLNYSGSLINLYNSHNNNGSFKSGGGHVYNPPTRNWVFDATFLDVNRLPPGTPYFQKLQITGFQRVN